MPTVNLSEDARNLLQLNLAERVAVTDDNLHAYRELEAAGLVTKMGSFTKEASYWLTDEGWARCDEILARTKAAG